jgi:16S rRNA (cytidine1402-2'-O)-methyltransferase
MIALCPGLIVSRHRMKNDFYFESAYLQNDTAMRGSLIHNVFEMNDAQLHVVATPIGNLEDITLRALEVLGSVDVIAAEDTRRTRILTTRHNISTPLVTLQEHNEEQKAPLLVERLCRGESVALVSDAGTPLLSDPGFRLVRLAVAAGIEVVTVPGPCSITAALSISGLATDRFTFEGFLPARASARLKHLSALAAEPRTMVFFESSHRIRESLGDLAKALGDERDVAVCREMTKQFETVLRGSIADIIDQVDRDSNQRKGEFVLVVSGHRSDGESKIPEALALAKTLLEYLPVSQAARVAARLHGVSRRELYAELDKND